MAAAALSDTDSAEGVPVTLTRPEPAYLQRKKKLEAAAFAGAASGTDGMPVALPVPHDSEAT